MANSASGAPREEQGQTRPRERGGNEAARGPRSRGRGGAARPSSQGGRTDGRNRGGDLGNNGRGSSRAGGRGRGGRARAEFRDQSEQEVDERDPATSQPPPQPGGNGVFGVRLTKDAAESTQGETAGAETAADDEEGELCFICASPVVHWSVAPCNHRTCHICALRLRVLNKTKSCAHCRTEAAYVIFTDEAEKRYEEYQISDFFETDSALGIRYETHEIYKDTEPFLTYNCPDKTCTDAFKGWPSLHRHVREAHERHMCDLCTRNMKIFPHEHELFTRQELGRHEKFGDNIPGAIPRSGFKGHPECTFCRQRFYGDDELYRHLRERHEECHLCSVDEDGNRVLNPPQFANFRELSKHFLHEHYPCIEPECLEQKFVVFKSPMDLQRHQLDVHANNLSKDAIRNAQRVDMSNFNFRPQYEETRRGGRRGGRGRDPNAEASMTVSAAHRTRAEMAHQREREIQSAQSVSTRSFGGQLTRSDPPHQQARPQPQSPLPSHTQPTSSSAQTTSPRPAEALSPQEQARRTRHAAVIERASNLLGNDRTKLEDFKERISSYRRDGISARDLIHAFFALFDTSSDELGKLIKELAEIFEVSGKRESLLAAWSDWRAINEDYPSLPGRASTSGAGAGTSSGGISSTRLLQLKKSGTQGSRSAAHRQATWNSTAAAGIANPFPALPTRAVPSARAAAVPAPTPGWLALRPASTAATGSSSQGSSARASPMPSRQGSSVNLSQADAFPALPAAKKPTSTVFSPGYTGAGVIRIAGSGGPGRAWGANGASTQTSSSTEDATGDQPARKKGNKGKKQVVISW